jgi:hypothetical protein
MIEEVVCQLFSARCNLKSLQLGNINNMSNHFKYRTWVSNSSPPFNSIQYEHQSSCVTLRRLHIRINEADFIENLIERLPNLEEMSVQCFSLSNLDTIRKLNLRTLRKSNENWFNKVNEIRFFFCS